MNKKTLFSLLFLFGVCILFFYKTFLFAQLPFPGDLLINENPYKGYSFLGYAPGGYPAKGQGRDVIREILPWKQFSLSEVRSGRVPFWNPYNFSGSIQMQNFQTALFYPMNVLFLILPFGLAWSLFIFSQSVLASFFMFFFLRRIQRSYGASILGSIAFAFSSYMSVWMEYGNIGATFLWLPLMLLFLHDFVKKPHIRSAIGFLITAIVAFFAGYIQGYFYMMVIAGALGLYVLIQEKKLNLGPLIRLTPLFIIPFGIGALQLLPTLDVFSSSTRVPYTLSQIQFLLNPVWLLPTLFAPDFFGNPATQTTFLSLTYIERVMYPGIIISSFFVISFFLKKQKYMMFFIISGLVALLLSLRLPGVDHFFQIPIPMLSTGVPTRILSVFLFCTSVVAAYVMDIWWEKSPKKIVLLPVLILLGLWLFVFIAPHFGIPHADVMRKSLIIPTGIFAGLLICLFTALKYPLFAKTLLISLVIGDLFFFFQKITPFSPSQFLYPQTPVITYLHNHAGFFRTWGYGDAYIPPNIETFEGIYAPEGEDPLHMKWYGDLLASSDTGELPVSVPRPDANIAPGFGVDGLKNNPYRQRLLNLLGVKYILNHNMQKTADTSTFPKEQYSLDYADGRYQIYENKSVLPRAFVTNQTQIDVNEKNAIHDLYHADNPSTVILSSSIDGLDPFATGAAMITRYSPQDITITTHTTGKMLMMLSDTYYQSWQATLDGKLVRTYQTNIAFRGVVVPSGNHTVHMTYIHIAFTKGLIITFVSSILAVGYLFLLKKYGQKN